jgi:hypothetical protein
MYKNTLARRGQKVDQSSNCPTIVAHTIKSYRRARDQIVKTPKEYRLQTVEYYKKIVIILYLFLNRKTHVGYP